MTSGAGGTLFYETVTHDHLQVPSTQTNNQTAICRQDNNWKLQSLGTGGFVSNAQMYDLNPFSSTALTTRLAYEAEVSDSTAGKLCEWHLTASESSSADTTQAMGFNNGSINASQEDKITLWPTTNKLVLHLSSLLDSSQTPVTLNTSPTPPAFVTGLIGNAASFTTDPQWIRTQGAPAKTLVTSGPVVDSAWFNTATTGQLNKPLFCQNDGDSICLLVSFNTACKLQFGVSQSGNFINVESTNTYCDGNWHYAVGYWLGSGNPVKLNIDGGAEIITGAVVTGALDTPGHSDFTVGNYYHPGVSSPSTFLGLIEEARFRTFAITDNFIRTEYVNQKPSSTFLTFGAKTNATAGTGITWAVQSGTLQTGFTLAANGTLSGTPTQAATRNIVFRATDSAANTADSSTIALTVSPAISISPSTLTPPCRVSLPCAFTVTTTGGNPPYTYSLSSSGVLNGFVVSPGSGSVSTADGIAQNVGVFNFDYIVSDSTLPTPATVTQPMTLTVLSNVSITTNSLPNGVQNVAYSQTMNATGGLAPYTWAVTVGTLPVGLTLSTNGIISGTPTGTGTSNFTITATDAANGTTPKALSITNNSTFSIVTPSLGNGVLNRPYSQTVATVGGAAPRTFSVLSGTLPNGLTLAPSTGVISGTPSVGGPTFSFRIRATDNNNVTADSNTYNVTIATDASAGGRVRR
jgi:hypothetical protein